MSNPTERKVTKKKRDSETRSWVVRARCVVIKEVICDNCTQEEATKDLWEHAVSEHESEQIDWEIVGVSPNE